MAPRGRPRSSFGETGYSGLRQWAGDIAEEWLPQLRGRRGVLSYKTMLGTDATVSAVMTGAKMAVKQVSWFIEPGGSEPIDSEVAEFTENAIFEDLDQSWQEKLNEILTIMDYGWAWFEEVYKKRDDGKIAWKKWGFRPQETLSSWEFDASNELVGMNQQVTVPASKSVLIPLTKSLHFTLNATKGNPEGVSLLRGAYMAWYNKHKLEIIELIGIERNLAGLPDIKIPAENFEKKNTAVLNKYVDIAKKVHRNEDAYILTPSDPWPGSQVPMYSVGLVGGQQLTTRGTGLPTIQPIARYQAEIARCFLADFMLLPAGGPGSYALSSNKSSFFVMFIETLCDAICDIVNKQAIPRLIEANTFGEVTEMPKLVHGNVSRTDIADLGRLLSNLYKAGAEIFPNDQVLNEVLDNAGLPRVKTPEDVEEAEVDVEADTDISATKAANDAAKAAAQMAAQGPSAEQAAAGLPISPAQVGSAAMGRVGKVKKKGTQPAKPNVKVSKVKSKVKPKAKRGGA